MTRARSLAFLALLLRLATPSFSGAAGPLGLSGSDFTSSDGVAYTIYSGLVPSFDGVPLDVDLTVPQGSVTPRPLVVMLHGWGGSKADWESTTVGNASPDKDHYNNVAFVARGYAVLNYTARGFHRSCGPEAPPTPACTRGWTHLADRRFEIRDTRYLVGLLADAGVAMPDRIGVTGGSYGGGQSWLLAIEADRVTVVSATDPEQVTLDPWTSPLGTPLHLAVAVPKYPWTDLANALMPSGRASDGTILRDGNRLVPIGIMKFSFVTGLFVLGRATASYAPPGVDPTADLQTWYAAINAGEPYEANPTVSDVVHQVTAWKSAYYQDSLVLDDRQTGHEVPVLDVQGWTDDLFPEVEGASMVSKLQHLDRRWPVSLWVADVGHQIAQNKSSDWGPINAAAGDFLDTYLLGGGGTVASSVRAQVTTCDATVGALYTARRLRSLAPRRLHLRAAGPSQTTTSAPSDPAGGAATDPIANGGKCVVLAPGTPTANAPLAVWEFPLTTDVTLLGEPVVTLGVSITGQNAEVNSRIWDVAPDGTRTLVTRGAYRILVSGAATITHALNGNGWRFPAGHTLRLEVLQNDAPFVRADNEPSSITYGALRLDLPVARRAR